VINLPTQCDYDDDDFNISKDVLSRWMRHLYKVLDHFWNRWQREYLLSLRDCHRYSKGTSVLKEFCVGDVVVLYDDSSRRGFWKLAKVEMLIRGVDGQVRGAVVRVPSREGRTTTLRRPVNQLYPLEISSEDVDTREEAPNTASLIEPPATLVDTVPTEPKACRPRRAAANLARDWMQAVLNADDDEQ